MNTSALILVTIIVCGMLGVAVGYVFQRNRSVGLRRRFGPEYPRAIAEAGSQWKAESALEHRAKRVQQLHIRPLDPSEREHFREEWHELETSFVDHPSEAVVEADRFVGRVLSAEGYPVLDFDQQVADLSVNHATAVENYREAHRIAVKNAQGRADTESLRHAMLLYRTVFEDLAGRPELTTEGEPLAATTRQ
jgi:hypothetical protein